MVIWCFEKRKQCTFVWYYVACATRLISLSNIAKRVISDKKHSARTEWSINIGKKTIQVSNFHNAAETDVNLTGRKQILIWTPLFVFWRKNGALSSEKILNRTKYGLIFQKKKKGFFFWKRFWTKREILPFRFPKAERFFILRATERKNRLILFTEKLSGRKTAFIQKALNRLTREQNFLIIDWHCYIIITIVTKK